MSGLYPSLYEASAPVEGSVMPDVYMVEQKTPDAPYPYAVAYPSPAAAVNPAASGRKLIYIGVRNMVICRDMTDLDRTFDVWKYEMGSMSALHFNETYVVLAGNIVIARHLKTLVGLDPMDGSLRWKYALRTYGSYDCANIVVSPFAVFIGLGD